MRARPRDPHRADGGDRDRGERRILVRDAEALERAHAVTVAAFDKTGTLTEGRPAVVAVHAVDGVAREPSSTSPLRPSAARSTPSRRPSSPRSEGRPPLDGTGDHRRPRPGIRTGSDGRAVVVGSRRWMDELGVVTDGPDLEADGSSVMWVAVDGAAIGAVAVRDRIREPSAAAVRRLREMGIRTVLLTGDHRAAAEAVGSALGVDAVRYGLLPDEKASAVRDLEAAGDTVAMVGDGVNDAPALAAASVGIAMGTGTDVARSTAGITVMRADPTLVADAIAIGRATVRKIRQNLFWAFLYNAVGIPLAALGLATPMLAGAAMAFSSVSVVSNALLLRRRWRAGWRG